MSSIGLKLKGLILMSDIGTAVHYSLLAFVDTRVGKFMVELDSFLLTFLYIFSIHTVNSFPFLLPPPIFSFKQFRDCTLPFGKWGSIRNWHI